MLLETIQVCLFAESRLIREALTEVLSRQTGMRPAASACFSSQALEQFADLGPRVVLLDFDSFTLCGVQCLEGIHKAMPMARVIMLGMQADNETFLRSARAGIAGYVLRDASASDVVAAVLAVAKGEAVCPSRLCMLLLDSMARQSANLPSLVGKFEFGLTRREQQLIHMISRGLSNKEIAGELNLSDQTVKHHVHQILGKVGVNDRMTAAEVCRMRGMIA